MAVVIVQHVSLKNEAPYKIATASSAKKAAKILSEANIERSHAVPFSFFKLVGNLNSEVEPIKGQLVFLDSFEEMKTYLGGTGKAEKPVHKMDLQFAKQFQKENPGIGEGFVFFFNTEDKTVRDFFTYSQFGEYLIKELFFSGSLRDPSGISNVEYADDEESASGSSDSEEHYMEDYFKQLKSMHDRVLSIYGKETPGDGNWVVVDENPSSELSFSLVGKVFVIKGKKFGDVSYNGHTKSIQLKTTSIPYRSGDAVKKPDEWPVKMDKKTKILVVKIDSAFETLDEYLSTA